MEKVTAGAKILQAAEALRKVDNDPGTAGLKGGSNINDRRVGATSRSPTRQDDMLTNAAARQTPTREVFTPNPEMNQAISTIERSKSSPILPELRITTADHRPRGFWSELASSPAGRVVAQVVTAGRKTLSLGVCAVVLGAVAVSHGAGARGAALDVSSAPIPVTAAEQARPSSPTMSVASVNQTDPTQFSGKVVRHPETQNVIATLAARARKGQAAAVQFLLGNDLKFQSWGHSYHTGEARRINIGQAPKDGVVRGTAVLHPSGHSDAVAEFARSNTYTVRVELPDGRVLERSGIPRNVVSDGKLPADTPEYSTAIDIAYPYQSGVTKVAAWPDGSAGVAGYVEGRLYYVHSHDAPWDVDAQQRKSEAHRLAHPQVRWGTPHERSDRKKHGVSPDPRAYRHYSND